MSIRELLSQPGAWALCGISALFLAAIIHAASKVFKTWDPEYQLLIERCLSDAFKPNAAVEIEEAHVIAGYICAVVSNGRKKRKELFNLNDLENLPDKIIPGKYRYKVMKDLGTGREHKSIRLLQPNIVHIVEAFPNGSPAVTDPYAFLRDSKQSIRQSQGVSDDLTDGPGAPVGEFAENPGNRPGHS
jgi:hypothetical protein